MSVGSVSSVVAAASTDRESSVLVAKKALDVQKQQGAAIIRLMESAMAGVQKGLNVNIVV